MYGKFFDSAFTGSMLGAGPTVFAVWGYVIANTVNSQVELNPKLLAPIIGTTPDDIQNAISYLEAVDPQSRTPTEEGRRLVREGQFAYRVVNHEQYRALRSEDDRRDYMRDYMRTYRKAKAVKVNGNDKLAVLAHTEADTDTEAEENTLSVSDETNGSVFPKGLVEAAKFWNEVIAVEWEKRKVTRKTLQKVVAPYRSIQKHMRTSGHTEWTLEGALRKAHQRLPLLKTQTWFQFRQFLFQHDYLQKNENLWEVYYESQYGHEANRSQLNNAERTRRNFVPLAKTNGK